MRKRIISFSFVNYTSKTNISIFVDAWMFICKYLQSCKPIYVNWLSLFTCLDSQNQILPLRRVTTVLD